MRAVLVDADFVGPTTSRPGRPGAAPTPTTVPGTWLHDTGHSLQAGPRGPVLLRDHHLREVPCRRL
ncbi:hypothetical protein ACGFYY_04330 [Streptomyces sp. NPDC048331]|uniref:hypothetical protein n=1 Tax=Streptomyces sp. NPDC048331 TaxID=3365534 RepID=UPI003720CE1A